MPWTKYAIDWFWARLASFNYEELTPWFVVILFFALVMLPVVLVVLAFLAWLLLAVLVDLVCLPFAVAGKTGETEPNTLKALRKPAGIGLVVFPLVAFVLVVGFDKDGFAPLGVLLCLMAIPLCVWARVRSGQVLRAEREAAMRLLAEMAEAKAEADRKAAEEAAKPKPPTPEEVRKQLREAFEKLSREIDADPALDASEKKAAQLEAKRRYVKQLDKVL